MIVTDRRLPTMFVSGTGEVSSLEKEDENNKKKVT
jgi:hypothetical protein